MNIGIALFFILFQTNTGQVIPTICGANNGEHIYIDIGAANSDTATVA